MNQDILGQQYLPTILIVKNYPQKLRLTSKILAAFNQVYVPTIEVNTVLPKVQQQQPDLVILDFEYSKIVTSGLIIALRLDWLTRSIPIVLISNSPQADLDCDVYLTKNYSKEELKRTICSFVNSPVCKNLLPLS